MALTLAVFHTHEMIFKAKYQISFVATAAVRSASLNVFHFLITWPTSLSLVLCLCSRNMGSSE